MIPPNRQIKQNKDQGRDSHSRDFERNKFQPQSTQTFQMVQGEVFLTQPEPVFSQNAVSVKMSKGGVLTGVGYPGAFIDPITGNLHGSYEGPIPGQSVTIGFMEGNSRAPFIVNRFPYQGTKNTFLSPRYILPMTTKMYDSTDVLMGHFSGSVIRLNTGLLSGKLPGSISIEAMTTFEATANVNFNVSAKVNAEISALVSAKLSGASVSIEGTTELKLKGGLVEIKSTAQSMKTLIDSLFGVLEGLTTVGVGVAPGSPLTVPISPATIALLEAEKAKWALLLK
jgi:hypothetical protein